MQHAGGNHPARAGLQAIGLRQVEDAVVALVPVLQAAADVGLGRARLQAHERVVEMVLGGVELRREVVALGLALLAGQRGVLVLLVHVVRDGAHVVEELRVDRPALVLLPHRLADDPRPGLGHGVAEQEPLALEDARSSALRRGARSSLAASVVLANQRSSMPPRCVPRAYQSVGASLIRLPGCRKLRGTQLGVSRSSPSPASKARSRIAPTLSFFTIFDAHMVVRSLPKIEMMRSLMSRRNAVSFYSLPTIADK